MHTQLLMSWVVHLFLRAAAQENIPRKPSRWCDLEQVLDVVGNDCALSFMCSVLRKCLIRTIAFGLFSAWFLTSQRQPWVPSQRKGFRCRA